MSTDSAQRPDEKDHGRALVWRLHAAVVKALAPDDWTGHIPNCGYTHEVPECGCAEFGERLYVALAEVVAPTEVGAS